MRVRRAAALLALFLLSLGLRGVNYPLVVNERGVQLAESGDSYYHLRRIWYTAARFPDVLERDPYFNYPAGGEVVWTAPFDWSIAATARLLTGGQDQDAVERVAIWASPVLGAATVVLAAALAWVQWGALAGMTAGLLLAVLPAHWFQSQLGMLDHHVAVGLASTALLALTVHWLSRPSAPRAAALGAGMAGVVGLWPGGLIHVGIVQVFAALWVLAADAPREAARRAGSLALALGLAAALLAPFCVGRSWTEYSAWSPFVLSNLQPAWLAGGAAGLAALTALWSRWPLGRAARAATALGLAALAGAALAPALRASVLQGFGWFAAAEDFQLHVIELQPLLRPHGRFDPERALRIFTPLLLAFPFVLGALALGAWRRGAPPGPALLLFFWALVFSALTLLQRRFESSFGIAFALVWGAAAATFTPSLRRHPRALGGALALGLFVLANGLTASYGPTIERAWRATRDPAVARRGPLPLKPELYARAARWLHANSEPTRGYLDPTQEPEYSVLTSWGTGHHVRYRAERPLVQDNFGVYGGRDNFERAWAYYAAEDEDEALRHLAGRRVRYVVADRRGAGSSRPYGPRSMTHRLVETLGSRDGATPALSRHRLVYRLEAPKQGASVAIWQVVPGARIEGRTAPGERVDAQLRLSSHVFRTSTDAGPDGRYSLRVPYPTEDRFSTAVLATGRYRLSTPSGTGWAEVPEAAVQAGRAVAGPLLVP